MRLRQQLALLALAGLLTPGLTLYSLRIFNEQAKASHLNQLTGIAQAVAARLGNDIELLTRSALADSPQRPAGKTLYSHTDNSNHSSTTTPSTPSPITVDGSAADWHQLAIPPLPLPSETALTAQYRSLTSGERTYLLIEVDDKQRHFHNAEAPHHDKQPLYRTDNQALASGDHLLLYAGAQDQHLHILRAEVPGQMTALYRNALGKVVTQEAIQGLWRETNTGYQVELSLPTNMTQTAMALAAVDQSPTNPQRSAGTLPPYALSAAGPDPGVLPPAVGQMIRPAQSLNSALEVFTRPNTRLSLIDKHHWQRGQAGELADTHASPSITQRLLGSIMKMPRRPTFETASGHWNHPDISYPNREPRAFWARDQDALIATVAVPLISSHLPALESRHLGSVIIEQRVQPWQLLDQDSIKRLLASSLLGGGLLLLLLLGYASFLSARIAKLSRAANQAKGQNLPESLSHWPQFTIQDEIAELSQHYYEVLTQLQDHNHYLRTLTGKLSHELRTPLAVVTGSLDNLQQSEGEDVHKYTHRAQAGSERLSFIISAMTEASRVEASIASAELVTVNLQQLISDISQAYSSAYPAQRFMVDIQPASTGTYEVKVAPELLVQMLDKLVDNAVGFARDNTPVTLGLNYQSTEQDGVILALSVCNQGPHLPNNMQGRLFQSLTSHRPRSGGDTPHLGLGLYIVELITRFHGGTATATDLPDGVKVCVTIPALYPELNAQRRTTSVDNTC
ncbi:ATP-binding protein [Gilvimarinus sp. 1_MG-2023]|uniref:ATP-binding protein n=1 Tax=Gilvimarinus sp. 1_MG-2023 TaxID=3062638 RepID=UPI0026E3C059|nr:ATP-binding protein [Gilvimarinus sp. 1_MG-2023]MDO6747869.1 histidine kinase dimerization/phospho-acceptor domain-containing protein [Gilvimarinus sp. 1_MG-2023]